MVTLALLAWLAAARAAAPNPSDVDTLRWVALVPEHGNVQGDERLVQVPGEEPLGARCDPGVVPHRRALYPSGLVEGAFSSPVQRGTAWVFPPGPPGADAWVVRPATCALYRLVPEISPATAAHAERNHTPSEVVAAVLASEALPDDEARWLAVPGAPAERWVTLRPPGPNPDGYAHWSGRDGGTFTIHGPRRLVILARWLDTPRPLCLHVDDITSCRTSGPDVRPVFLDGKIAWAPREEQTAGRMLAWHVLLPPGPHHVSLDGPADVQITGTWPILYTEGTREVHPTEVRVEPPGPPPPVATVHPTGTPATLLLFGPDTKPIRADDVRWLPLDSPALRGATRVDASGVFTLHLQPESDAPCTVQFASGTIWQGRPEDAVQRFLWTGAAPSKEWPIVQGCRARVRVTGVTGAADAWVGSRWWWAQPGDTLKWKDPPPEAHLWLRHPADRQAPYRVRILHPSGRVSYWTIDPRGAAPDRWTARGGAWEPAIDLRLEPGSGPVEVWTDAPVIARLTGLAPASPPGSPPASSSSPATAALAPLPPPTPEDLRVLTRAIAASRGTLGRARALLQRSRALEALGDDREAWTDWERAEQLAPDVVEDNPLTDVLRQRTATLLFGAGRWVPDDAIWIPADAPAGTEAHAREGDWLGVAERISDAGGDPRPWWRQAIIDGQILTAAQRLDMYRALVANTPPAEVDHPWLWPLRLLSKWEPVNQVRGVPPRAVHWPSPPPERPDLYPEPWPEAQTIRFIQGYELQVPQEDAGVIAVRCRSTRIEQPAPTCLFRALDRTGRVLADTTTDTWGTTGFLHVPAGTGTVYVDVSPTTGVEAEVRQPPEAPRDEERTGWSVRAGESVAFEVLGPTVLRLETWRPQPGPTTLTVEMQGPDGTTRTEDDTEGLGQVLVDVDRAGPVRVRVTPTQPVRLIPWIRVPRAASRMPLPDQAWIDAGFATQVPPPKPVKPAPAVRWVPPHGRPVPRPPVTVYLRTAFGTANLDQVVPQPSLAPSPRGFQTIGITSRPGPAPLWFDLEARGDVGQSGGLFSVDGLTEWRAMQRSWSLWVLGQGQWVRGLNSSSPLSTLDGRVRLTADLWLHPRWDFQLRAGGELRGIVAGAWDPIAYGQDMLRLWSTWKDAHRRSITGEARASYRLQPWLDTTLRTWMASNQDFVQPPELWGAAARADGGVPGLWWRAAVQLERRFADANRSTGYWAPKVLARAAYTPWPDRDLGLQLRLSAEYRFHFHELDTLLEIRIYANRDRALRDVAPALLPEAHLSGWYQEEAAERRSKGGAHKR